MPSKRSTVNSHGIVNDILTVYFPILTVYFLNIFQVLDKNIAARAPFFEW